MIATAQWTASAPVLLVRGAVRAANHYRDAIGSGGGNAGSSARGSEVGIEAGLRERYRGFARAASWAPGDGGLGPLLRSLQQDPSLCSFDSSRPVLKEKRLPDVSPAVDASFMAEGETRGLTAEHPPFHV
jgi:hypothetical protein